MAKVCLLYRLCLLKQQSHSSVEVKRAPGVLKKLQNSTYVRHTFKARWVRLVYVRSASLYVAKNRRAFRVCLGSKKI